MADSKSLAVDFGALRSRPVRVTIPAKIAFDLNDFQETLANLAERLGCRACLSGADYFFQLEQDLVVNPAREIQGLRDLGQGF